MAIPCVRSIASHLENNEAVVLEGTRNPAELEHLQRELGSDTLVIWISAYLEDRVEWFNARKGRESGVENLFNRTIRERNAGMNRYFDNSDVIINNRKSKMHLFLQLCETARQFQI